MKPRKAAPLLALLVLMFLPSAQLAAALPWAESLEPDGHIWPDRHTCAVVSPTSDGFLAVRSAGAATATFIGKLKTGAFVDVAACTNDTCRAGTWREVTSNDESDHPLHGWVNAKYLRQTACLDEP